MGMDEHGARVDCGTHLRRGASLRKLTEDWLQIWEDPDNLWCFWPGSEVCGEELISVYELNSTSELFNLSRDVREWYGILSTSYYAGMKNQVFPQDSGILHLKSTFG